MASSNLFKKYYCKINGKSYGPMTLEQLKNLAIQGQLQSSDKVSLTFPAKEWLEAGSISALIEIFKTQAETTNADEFVFDEVRSPTSVAYNEPSGKMEYKVIPIIKKSDCCNSTPSLWKEIQVACNESASNGFFLVAIYPEDFSKSTCCGPEQTHGAILVFGRKK